MDTLLIYFKQADYFHSLAMNAPNLYIFVPDQAYDWMVPIGIATALLVTLGVVYLTWKKSNLSKPLSLLVTATFIVMLIPFILPKMHDRYFFPAGVFLIALCFYSRRFILAALAVQGSLLAVYLRYFFDLPVLYAQVGAILNLLVVVFLAREWISTMCLKRADGIPESFPSQA